MPSEGKREVKLVVVQHPGQTFYKDEGGKSNHLTASVSVDKKESNFGTLTIKPILSFESGKPVEDGTDIFRILSMEPKTITSADQQCVVKFRIEKVSRRKDGQKFSVRFDASSSTPGVSAKSCFTGPTCVLSKRKFPSVNTGQKHGLTQKKVSPAKRSRSNSSRRNSHHESNQENSATDALKEMVRKLEAKVCALSKRVTILEKEKTALKLETRPRAESFVTDCYSPTPSHSENEPVNDRFSLDFPNALVEVDEREMVPLKKELSNGIEFDFGLPTSNMIASPYPY